MTDEERKAEEALETILTYCKTHSCVSCKIQNYCEKYFHICPFFWSIEKENCVENNKR